MKSPISLLLITFALLLVNPAAGQEPPAGSPLRSLIDTERAFSRLSVAEGTRAAFLAFFADDGVSFAPEPVNTKASINGQPAPAKPSAVILEWVPVTADIARAGDLGYTTGPWVQSERTAARKPLAWGWYFTVWKKQADGSWKAAADIGTDTPPHALPDDGAFRPASAGAQGSLSAPARGAGAADIAATEKTFSRAASASALDAYLAHASDAVRLHRDGREPVVGMAAVRAFFADRPARITSTPLKTDVSQSGDLGYTYGSYVAQYQGPGVAPEERGYYLRVWKHLGERWRLVADITNAAPAPAAPR